MTLNLIESGYHGNSSASQTFSAYKSPVMEGLLPSDTLLKSNFISPISSMDYKPHIDTTSFYLHQPRHYGSSSDFMADLFSPPRLDVGFIPKSPYLSPILASIPSPGVHHSMKPDSPMMDTPYNSGYLQRLYNNPMFQDLQKLLAQECLHMQVPTNLINNPWTVPTTLQHPGAKIDVFSSHMKLQEKFLHLRSDEAFRNRGLQIESEYSSEVGQIEVARYQALCRAGSSESQRMAVNIHFDEKRMLLIQKCEKDLECLMQQQDFSKLNAQNSLMNKEPVLKLDHVKSSEMAYPHGNSAKFSAVARQLNFPATATSTKRKMDNHSDDYDEASSPECLEVDIGNDSALVHNEENLLVKDKKVNLCDSGLGVDDSSSVSSESGSDVAQLASDLCDITEEDFRQPQNTESGSKSEEKVNTWSYEAGSTKQKEHINDENFIPNHSNVRMSKGKRKRSADDQIEEASDMKHQCAERPECVVAASSFQIIKHTSSQCGIRNISDTRTLAT